MWKNLRHSKEMIRQFNEERRQYFLDAKDENARSNLRILKKVSVFSIVFLIVVSLLAPHIITGWQISPPYFWFLPAVLFFSGYSILYARRPEINSNVANISCVAFIIVLELLVLLIDVFLGSSSQSSFMPMIFIMVSGVFIFPFRVLVPLLAGTEMVYVFALVTYKSSELAQVDIFTSLVGLMFGYLMALTVVQLRIKDNNAKREYQKRSMVDPVTGILNKFSFENSVREALKAREVNTISALLVLDIDNLKRMNDELGTLVGDMFLGDVADYLTHIFRGSDIIGRVGGDEFMVYIRSMDDEEWLSKKCIRLQQEVKALSNEHGNINMTISIGAAIVKERAVGFDQMYCIADNSLYKAKTRGRGKFCVSNISEGKGETGK